MIVIDGGRGQLKAAQNALHYHKLEIPMITLAKREEEIFVPGRALPVHLPKNSLVLRLIQQIRDEAHRFALSYHHKLRLKNL